MQQRKKIRRKERAFSFIELLIVMNVMMILMGLAIPYVRVANKSANEQSAVESLQTLSACEELYRPRQNPPTYAPDFTTLSNAKLINGNLVSGAKDGYLFSTVGTPGASLYSFRASPSAPSNTGDRYFFIDQSGIIRVSMTGPAQVTDPPLG